MRKKAFKAVIVGISLLSLVFLLAAFFTEKTDSSTYQSHDAVSYFKELELEETQVKDSSAKQGVIRNFVFKVTDADKEENLMFYVIHSNTQVYVDGKLIYERSTKDKTLVSSSAGCYWVKVGLKSEYNGKTIDIKIEPVYKNMINRSITFYEGKQYGVFDMSIKQDLPVIILGFVLIVLGIIFFVVSIYYRIENKNATNFVYLGLLAFFVGTWKVIDTQFMAWFFEDHERFIALLSNTCVILIPIAFQLHIISNYHKNDKFKRFMYYCALVNMIVGSLAFILDFLRVLDIRQYTDFYFCYMLLVIAIIFVFEIVLFSKEKKNKENVLTTVSSLILFAFSLLDIAIFLNKKRINSPNFLMIGALIYISVYALVTLKDMHDTYSRDRATGLYNRNRCNELIRFMPKNRLATFIVFDVNNLKQINDNFGHEAGDIVLKKFADIMCECIPAGNFLGRSGGDEFIAVVYTVQKNRIEKIINDINEHIDEYNKTSGNDFELSVAVGYAFASETSDANYRDLNNLADKRMYENKRRMKNEI